MRTIPSVERGCGSAVPGGFYLSATRGAGGILEPWTWLLGDGVEGGYNVYLNPPERMHTLFNLPYTLATSEHQTEAVDGVTLVSPLDRLKPIAILDHVGKAHYDPYQFADEVEQLLPNRRISHELAAKLVPLCPIPIVFTHEHIPVVHNTLHRQILLEWALDTIRKQSRYTDSGLYEARDYYKAAVWTNEKWGLKTRDSDGKDHWLVPVLQAINLVGGIKNIPDMMQTYVEAGGHDADGNPPPRGGGAEYAEDDYMLSSEISWIEQPFGASWITRVTYVAKDDDTESTLQRIKNMGIEPVRIVGSDGMESVDNKF